MDRIGRYKIVRELGRGAMGVVYHAIDPNIGRPVAIKTIRLSEVPKPEEQERLRDRLFREARSAGMLSHPGIVTIYDVEQQGDLAYIAMEYVDGPTLDHVLSRSQALPGEQMFSILGQTAAALDYAHQKGIVHRDIKPANIMLTADGTAKITDFGIAKINTSEQFTMTGTIVGTPHYMSPEQVQGLPIDGRSDQFSLAVLAYEMLTGEKPYTGEHLTTVVYKIVAEEPASPHRLNPSLTAGIENVLRKALSKKPEARYRNCQEFSSSLERACAATRGWKTMPRGGSLSEPTVSDSVKPAVSLPPARRTALHGTDTAERGPARKSNFVPFLMAILVLGGLLALLGWQAGPWLSQNAAPQPRQKEAAATPTPPSTPAPDSAPPGPAAPSAEPPADKPSPMAPAASEDAPKVAEAPRAEEPAPGERASQEAQKSLEKRTPRPIATTAPITVVSSPGGATATLDGRPETACKTPCSLDATSGRHNILVTMPGYQTEHRQVDVGSGPIELPPVILRAPGGTLMLTSVPPGASISVNGRKLTQITPAQITLAPGSYRVTVEKDGKENTSSVEVRDGVTNFLKVPLE